jgi:hypothetical protein
VVANHAEGPNGYHVDADVDSVLYKWNGTQFVNHQYIPTRGARDWEYIEFDNQRFLAVANEYNGFSYPSSTDIYSKIYRWDGNQFVEFQSVHSEGARDWQAYHIGDRHFLALANLYGSTQSPSTAEPAKVYEWNGTQFAEFQLFHYPVVSWTHALVDTRDYLLSTGSYPGNTRLYRWGDTQWDLHQELNTTGYDALFFKIGSTQYYVSLSSFYADGSYNTLSKVYKFE